jgi:hypothetical protein
MSPASVCACIFFEIELTLAVPSLSFVNKPPSVGPPTVSSSSERDGVPTEITRETSDGSPATTLAAAPNSPATVSPSSSTSALGLVAAFDELEPDVPPVTCAGDGAALTGALGLVVEGSAIE